MPPVHFRNSIVDEGFRAVRKAKFLALASGRELRCIANASALVTLDGGLRGEGRVIASWSLAFMVNGVKKMSQMQSPCTHLQHDRTTAKAVP